MHGPAAGHARALPVGFFLDLLYPPREGAEHGVKDLPRILLRPTGMRGAKVVAFGYLREKPATVTVSYGLGARRSYVDAYVDRHALPSAPCDVGEHRASAAPVGRGHVAASGGVAGVVPVRRATRRAATSRVISRNLCSASG